MKNIAFGIVIIILCFVIAVTTITITGVMNREVEIENALHEAVENSVEACTTRRNYGLDNNDQFVADLLVELSNAIENDADLKVDVMGVDKDKGYLSIRVTEAYKTLIGSTKTAMCETTAYLDRGNADITTELVTVTFVDDNGLYLGQQLTNVGSNIVPPITPTQAGRSFVGWTSIINEAPTKDLGTALFSVCYQAAYV